MQLALLALTGIGIRAVLALAHANDLTAILVLVAAGDDGVI